MGGGGENEEEEEEEKMKRIGGGGGGIGQVYRVQPQSEKYIQTDKYTLGVLS